MADTKIGILLQATGGQQVSAELGRVTRQMRDVDQVGQDVEKVFGKLGSGLKSTLLTFTAGFGAAALTREFLGIAQASERLEMTFRAISGSGAAAAEEMTYIRETASRLGIEVLSAADAYASLSAAAKGTTLEGGATRDIFEAVANAMAKLGKSSADTQGALLAVEQMISKGKVSAEELRGQLGERLPGAFKLAADAIGVSTEELDGMLKSGDLLAEDLLPKLVRKLNELYDDGQQVSTLKAEWNRFTNEIGRFATAADQAAGATDGLAGALRLATDAARALTDAMTGTISGGIPIDAGQWTEPLADINQQIVKTQTKLIELKAAASADGWFVDRAAVNLAKESVAKLTDQMARLTAQRQLYVQMAAEDREVERATADATRERAKAQAALDAEFEAAIKQFEELDAAYEKQSKSAPRADRAIRAAAGGVNQLAREVDRTIAGLEEQAQKLTLGERGFLAHELAAKGATQPQIDYALSVYDQVEALEAAQKGAQDTAGEVDILATVTERAAESMTDALSDAFANIFRDGVDSFKRLADTLKNLFFDLLGDLLAASLANPIRIALGVGGVGASGAASAAGSAASGGLNLLSPGGLIAPLVNGMPAGILGTAANMVSFGTAGLMSGTASGMLAGAALLGAVALPVLGGIAALAGAFGDKTDPRAQWVARTGTTGFEDDVSARSRLLGLSFGLGGKSHKVEASQYAPQLQAMAAAADAIGAAVGPAVAAQIAARVAGTTDQLKGSGLARDGWSAEDAFRQMFADILGFAEDTGDAVARILAERVGVLEGSVEDMAAAIQRTAEAVAGAAGLRQALRGLGLVLGETEEASLRAALHLADLAGGAQAMLQATAALDAVLVPEAERAERALAAMGDALAAVGLALPDSRAELRALVDGLDLTTAAGREAYVTVAALAQGLGTHFNAVERSAAELAAAEAALTEQRSAAIERLERLLLGEEAYAATQAERAQAELERIALERLGIETSIGSLAALQGVIDRLGGVSEAVRLLGDEAAAFAQAATAAFGGLGEAITASASASVRATQDAWWDQMSAGLREWLGDKYGAPFVEPLRAVWEWSQKARRAVEDFADTSLTSVQAATDQVARLLQQVWRLDNLNALPGAFDSLLAAAEREAPSRVAYELIARRIQGQAERLSTQGAADPAFYVRRSQGYGWERLASNSRINTDLQLAQMRALYEKMLRIFDRWDYDGLPATRT